MFAKSGPSASNFKSFSRSLKHFFLTVGQNNFGNKIPFTYTLLSGQCIYPGKVTDADTFRIGNIGDLFPKDMDHLVVCIMKVLLQMEVRIPVQY